MEHKCLICEKVSFEKHIQTRNCNLTLLNLIKDTYEKEKRISELELEISNLKKENLYLQKEKENLYLQKEIENRKN
jgi:hypothetical protein